MQALPGLVAATLVALALAGCAGADDDGDHMMEMGPDSFQMSMSGMPNGAMAPGHKFNVSVEGMAMMSGMRGTSDHMGAHFWNATMSDPTGSLGNSTACAHRGGEMPGRFTAMCTAPMQPGTYHLRGHMRMTDDAGAMHHYWSDEQTFTVS